MQVQGVGNLFSAAGQGPWARGEKDFSLSVLFFKITYTLGIPVSTR